ncbi:hypothetical protein EJ04DRAFT_223007 [Polyplosphaeria fusca]|uniref:Seipin n=1 Tax=Polyplosphaeria fusca TaxID=682080 RepID=A0A9P4QW91_9PLEO|nr:hypothetical protein EJ04DRAFT_223007 [Polyplosphaeria fusca]
MDDSDEDHRGLTGLLTRIKHVLLKPIHILLSPPVLRFSLRTLLALLTSFILLGTAILAYTTLYYTYIPIRSLHVPVYLQFDPTNHATHTFPYAVAKVHGLATRQKYDVEVQLDMPRSTRNLDAGNWMVPVEMRLELRARGPLDVYGVQVSFVARLEGLRWVMYRYWLISFVVFTGLFWGVEVALLVLTWGFCTLVFGGQKQEGEHSARKKIKADPDHDVPATPGSSAPSTPLSDTSRTFPTLSSHRPLHYTSGEGESADRQRVKDERQTPGIEDVPEAEADDEDDEDADFLLEPVPHTSANVLTDSGIGTSLESGVEGRGVRRRRSEKSMKRED